MDPDDPIVCYLTSHLVDRLLSMTQKNAPKTARALLGVPPSRPDSKRIMRSR
jgi:hypothetical protein